MLTRIAILSLTGAIGCGLRVLVRDWLMRCGLRPWWGVMAINLTGALAIGLLGGVVSARGDRMDASGAVVLVGILAGWTTYSAFAMDVVQLWLRGERAQSIIIWASTMLGAPLAALAGAALGACLSGGGA